MKTYKGKITKLEDNQVLLKMLKGKMDMVINL